LLTSNTCGNKVVSKIYKRQLIPGQQFWFN